MHSRRLLSSLGLLTFCSRKSPSESRSKSCPVRLPTAVLLSCCRTFVQTHHLCERCRGCAISLVLPTVLQMLALTTLFRSRSFSLSLLALASVRTLSLAAHRPPLALARSHAEAEGVVGSEFSSPALSFLLRATVVFLNALATTSMAHFGCLRDEYGYGGYGGGSQENENDKIAKR